MLAPIDARRSSPATRVGATGTSRPEATLGYTPVAADPGGRRAAAGVNRRQHWQRRDLDVRRRGLFIPAGTTNAVGLMPMTGTGQIFDVYMSWDS